MKKINILFLTLCLPFFALAQKSGTASPSGGSSGQTLQVTITGKGTHFIPGTGTTFVSFNAGMVTDQTIMNDTVLKATIKINKSAKTGKYDINISNNLGSLSVGFDVDGSHASDVVNVSPSSGNAGQTLDVTITGVNTSFKKAQNYVKFSFLQGTSTVTVIDDTLLKANVTIPSQTQEGNYDLNLSNSIDGSIVKSGVFHVNGVPKPSISSISPNSGSAGQTLDVTITGVNTHFSTTNNTKVRFGFNAASSTLDVNSITILNETSLKANVSIRNNTPSSYHDVYVQNTTDGAMTLSKGFYVAGGPCHSYFTTTYDSINNKFTLTLDSSASVAPYVQWNFGDGQTSNSHTPSHTFAKDTLYNVCLKVITAGGDSCQYCHVIGLDSAGNPVTRLKGFSMVVKLALLTTNIPGSDKETSVSVFPNPANDVLTISLSDFKETRNTTVSVYSIEGRLLLTENLLKDKTNIDISGFAKGIYLMQVRSNDESMKGLKFIKE
jgi:flagellar hook-basal body complex protein FliE